MLTERGVRILYLQVTTEMYEWVDKRAWDTETSKAAVVRAAIEREMEAVKKAG